MEMMLASLDAALVFAAVLGTLVKIGLLGLG